MNRSEPVNWLRDLLQVQHPIIQAPMAGVQDARLVVAVSNSGALGSLPCAMLTPDAVRRQITAIRTGTDRPFSVNFFCHTPPAASAQQDTAWRAALARYYAELGIRDDATPTGPARAPFDHEMADILEEFKPPVVSFHFGLPSARLLGRVRATGARIFSSATTVEEARWLEANGVDAIIAQGLEAGGHRGMFLTEELTTQLGTFALLPQVVRAVRVPVIAAGGIVDATGVAAAMALGAAAVQVGSAYLLCHEATTSAVHRAALKSDQAIHTALTNLFSGRPARGILNRIMRELGPISALAPEFPLAAAAIAPLRAAAESRGLGDFSPLWCGQNASRCQEVSAAEVTRELVAGC
jgi:nitronate monooxygenase